MLSLINPPLKSPQAKLPHLYPVTHMSDAIHFNTRFGLPPCDAQTTRIILVRHGRSTFNDQQRYQGSSDDAVLTGQGWQQARDSGQILRSIPVDAVYASPLKRVRQTLEGMVSMGPMPDPIFSEDLREIHLPEWEGRLYQEVRTEDAIAYKCWLQSPHEFQMRLQPQPMVPLSRPRGLDQATAKALRPIPQYLFPVLDLYRQAQTFWQKTVSQHLGQTIVVVSHGGTNHALISTALGLSPRLHHRLQQSNGGISILDYSHSTSTAQLRVLNCTRHLGEVLPKLKAGKQGLRLLILPVGSEAALPMGISTRESLAVPQWLQDIPITYSLTQTDPVSESIAHQLFRDRTDIVQLQIQHHDFSRPWHRALNQGDPDGQTVDRLITGIAIAPIPTLQSLIAQTIHLRDGLAPTLSLNPGKLSVLHFPVGDHPPILQALNLSHPFDYAHVKA